MPTLTRYILPWSAFIGLSMSITPTGFGQASSKMKPSKIVCLENSKPPSHIPPPGLLCAQEEFRKRGKPVMETERNDVTFGISSLPTSPFEVFIWMDNRTDEPQFYYICCRASFLDAVSVFDSERRRILSKEEEGALKTHAAGHEVIEVCSCSSWVTVAPHTMQVVDYGNLNDGYELWPGRYFLVPRNPRAERDGDRLTDAVDRAFSRTKNVMKIEIPND